MDDSNTAQKQSGNLQRAAKRPAIRPNMISAFRALRVLEILQNETDDTCTITAGELARRLREPDAPGLPPVPSDCKSVYTAVTCLRALGYDIRNRGREGYSLATRAFEHDELATIIEAVEGAPTVSRAQAHLCTDKLLALGTPTFRREFRLLRENAAREGKDPRPEPPRVQRDPRELALAAIEERLELAIEFEPRRRADAAVNADTAPALPNSRHLRCRIIPAELTECAGAFYLRGLMVGESGAAPVLRTFRLDRLISLSAQLPTGEIAVAMQEQAA